MQFGEMAHALVDEEHGPRAFKTAKHTAHGVLCAATPPVAGTSGATAMVAGDNATAVHDEWYGGAGNKVAHSDEVLG